MKRAAVILFWAYLAALTLATHVPRVDPAYLDYLVRLGSMSVDKTAHLLAYAVLGLFSMAAFWPGRGSPWMAIGRLLPLLSLYALCDEVTQPLIGRIADVVDWCCDVVGLAIGMVCAAMIPVLVRAWKRPSSR